MRRRPGGAALRAGACLAAGLLTVLASQPEIRAQSTQPVDREPISARRIVKHFDFNERPLGNIDPVPMMIPFCAWVKPKAPVSSELTRKRANAM